MSDWRLGHACGVWCASVRESWCQSVGVSANGGLLAGKGRAAGSGLERHLDWKIEGREVVSGEKGCGILRRLREGN